MQLAIGEQDMPRDMEEILCFLLQCEGWEMALMQPFAEGAGMDTDPDADIGDGEIVNHAQTRKNDIAAGGARKRSFHKP